MLLQQTARLAIRAILFVAAIAAAVAVGFAAQAWWRLPELGRWHTVRLGSEFKAGAAAPRTFAAYLAQEDRLFAELKQKI